MICRQFLLATRLNRLSGVLNAGVPSEVIKCVSEVGLRVISQSSRATQIIISQSHTPSVSVWRAEACAEGQASIMEDNNNTSVSTLTARQHTDTAKVKTVNKAKKEPRKASGKKKQKQKKEEAECLMCELPFTDAGVWRDLGFAGSESSVKKKRKRRDGSRVESEEDGDKKKKKEVVTRPNYFISVPITNPEIKQVVQDVQKLVLEKDSRLSRTLIPVDTLHITLLVAHLKTQEQVDLAVSTLSALESPLNTLLAGHRLILPFCGVGHFKQEVAFVRIAEGEHLNTLALIAESVRKAFEEKGIVSGDDKAFKPHLTFLKLSRAPKLRKQGVKKLDPALFSDFESRVFGDECVCRVDLCSMLKKKTSDGYYHREKSVTFSVKKADDEELVSLSKRLVEDAVSRAVQQYMDETQQNGSAPKDQGPPGSAGTLNSTK
ncbi:hypothetical protein R3I93_011946 [Phoxinus phoxinus]|uniref:A-kinase anchoring protein 7 n=1 Tax=Phoxinus phoxinus TaxID=58324 RepID=A0AAN9CV66_9TELE